MDAEEKREAYEKLTARTGDTFCTRTGGHDHTHDLEPDVHADLAVSHMASVSMVCEILLLPLPLAHALTLMKKSEVEHESASDDDHILKEAALHDRDDTTAASSSTVPTLEQRILSNVQLDKETPGAGSTVDIIGMGTSFERPAVIGHAGEQDAKGNMDYVQ